MKTKTMNVKNVALVSAVLSLFSGAALADVSIIGKMEAGVQRKSNVDGTHVNGVKDFGSEIDFVGSEDLGDGLKAIWQMNNNVHLDGGQAGDTFASGDTFVGLSGGFGAVKLGHGIDAYGEGYWKANFFDLGDHGPDRGVGGVLGLSDAGNSKGAVKYETPKFGQFNAAASWAAGEKGSGSAAGNAWALGANFEGASYGLHAGYQRQDLANNASAPYVNVGHADDWVAAGKVTPLQGLTLAAEYNHSRLSATTPGALTGSSTSFVVPADPVAMKSLMLLAEYKPDRLALRASVLRTDNYQYVSDKRRNEFVLGTSYDLSKRTALLAEYLRSKVSSDDRASSELVIGLHHGF
ncbi:porin Gram-negative type [Pseudogulbenkiania sp. NH8B]|uniref:porin n=1 Tax=Pseudogulbenkiania sp. (strain NH8B) TaxID=748280 RepID=UPI0002279DCE|nr:porin [Pseudogulbenkiania sp. NH8B]BAK76056.1 porin Gram-negative type [Pseudogulbenkiania sp. NH8B]